MNKININLKNVNETLLVPLYSRAIESKKPNPKFIDKTALNIINNSDYDFTKKVQGKMNINGCIARTIILDKLVSDYIKANPYITIINLGAGLDDRFHRVDNNKIHWYNIDMPNVIELRNELIEPNDRVCNIASSVLDSKYLTQIENKDNALVIAEGLFMYFDEDEIKTIFNIFTENFKKCTFFVELMSQWMVKNQTLHETTKNMNVTFKWGIEESKDVEKIVPNIKFYDEYNFTPEIRKLMPFLITLIYPILYKRNNRIGCFVKK